MASKSTRSRYYRVKGFTLDGHTANDNVSLQFTGTSTPMGSSSETDKHANHFLQGTQIAEGATIRIKDMCAAAVYRSKRGSIVSFSCTVPKATMGSATTDITFTSVTSNGGGALVKTVKMDGAFNKEGEAEITLIFRSIGTDSGMDLAPEKTVPA